jgi:hypothetical protein
MVLKTKLIAALFLISISLIVVMISCDGDDQPPIDVGYVNFQIFPNSTEYLQLNTVGGWAYVTANDPSRGIIIYRSSIDEFRAYERTPTYKPDSCCIIDGNYRECTRLVVDETVTFAVDTCSGTKYLLLDGLVVEGPAAYPMVQYNTRYDGETLFVYN